MKSLYVLQSLVGGLIGLTLYGSVVCQYYLHTNVHFRLNALR